MTLFQYDYYRMTGTKYVPGGGEMPCCGGFFAPNQIYEVLEKSA